MQPYTYFLLHKPTGLKYYGVRYSKNANPNKLWIDYFSSSKKIKKLIEEYGKDSFHFEIRKIFNTREEALLWEQNVLRRLGVDKRKDWINVHVFGGKWFVEKRTPEHQQKIANSNRGQKRQGGWHHSEETKKRLSEQKTGKKLSNYHIQRIKEAHNKPEVIEKHSKAMKGKPSNMLGKKHSEETKKKISITEKNTKREQRVPR